MKNNEISISKAVEYSLSQYLTQLEDTEPQNLYALVLSQVEKPLLKTVMSATQGNQSAAARWLGVSRNTLRKLLAKYQIVSSNISSIQTSL